ncbi:MAG: tetratricopeptide repeat protein [Phycisphaerales bacterium]|nr:tetratricopeptide repeat protein [Phycisphaerales bacterium]
MTNDVGLGRVFVEMKLLRDPPDLEGVLSFARTQRKLFRTDPFLLGAYAATLAYGDQTDSALRSFEASYRELRDSGASEVEMQQFMTWLPRIMNHIHGEDQAAEQASEFLDAVSNGEPGTGARLVMAQAWLDLGDKGYDKAIENLLAVANGSDADQIELAPLVALGSLLYRTGDCEQAIKAFDQALKKNPGDPALLNNCAFVRANCNGNLALARTEVRKAIDIDPFNGSYLDTLGYIQFLSGQLDEADRTLRKSVRRRKTPSNLMHLAELLIKQGDTEGAETLLREAGDLQPSPSEQENITSLIQRIATAQEGDG